MTDNQSNRLDMYNLVSEFYTANQSVIDTVTARTAAFTTHNANRSAILSNLSGQTSNTEGATADKAEAREQLSLISETVFLPVRAWATLNNDQTTRAEFDYGRNALSKIKDDTIEAFLNLRITIVNDNIAALADYGITPTLVTQWQDALTEYLAFLSAPRGAIVKRSVHTGNLKTLFKTTSAHLKDVVDPLMITLRASDPDVYAEYTASRIIIDRKGPGSGQDPANPQLTNLTGTVTHANSGGPLANVTVTIMRASGNVTVQTNAAGNYAANGMQLTSNETVQVRFSGTDLDERTEEFTLIPGQTHVLNIAMTSATGFFGNVSDNNGIGIPDATLRISTPEGSLETQTDSNGDYNFSLPGLTEPLSATLTAEALGMSPDTRPVTIQPGQQQEQNFQLNPEP